MVLEQLRRGGLQLWTFVVASFVVASFVVASFVVASVSGCLKTQPTRRLESETPIAVAIVHDRGNALGEVPAALEASVRGVLAARNLVQQTIGAERFEQEFTRKRASRDRFERVANLSAGAKLTLLVETRAQYYSQINGRFRWTVYVKLSLAKGGETLAGSTSNFTIPVLLNFDHQREVEALESAAETVATKVGKEIDEFIAGLDLATLATVNAESPRRIGPMYYVMLDRFHNGRSDNDQDIDSSDPNAFHGGDIAGLIEKLDHIRNLGFTTVWLSPVFSMRSEPIGETGAYHGYWTEDLRKLEERFGSKDELLALREALDARGMSLLMDVVLNHVGYDTRFVSEHPDWFHHKGDIKNWNDAVEMTTFDVHGLPDLAQENPEVFDFLLSASAHWIEVLQPAGFRLDAVKHASNEFWLRYTQAVRDTANGPFATVGELYSGDPRAIAKGFAEGGFSHLFDFPLYYSMKDTFCEGQHLGRLAATLSLDHTYPDANHLVTFADNHDVPRVWTACGEDEERVKALLTFMLTARGTPSMNYGTEYGMRGGAEPDNRRDMEFSGEPRFGGLIRTILKARDEHEVLRIGKSRALSLAPETFAYVREGADETALIAVNLGKRVWSPNLPGFAEAQGLDPLTGELVSGTPSVAPMSVSVRIFKDVGGPPLAAPRPATLVVEADAEHLVLVGASPALGAWTPERGISATKIANGRFRFSIPLPSGEVGVFKLVRKVGDEFQWETGGNRYIFSGALTATTSPPKAPPIFTSGASK